MKTKISLFALVLVSVSGLFSGCASSSKEVGFYSGVFDRSGLEVDRSISPSIVYKRPGASGLEAYDSFIIDPVRVIYDHKTREHDENDISELRQYFQEQLKTELSEAGYKITETSGPSTLRISPVMSNVTIPGAAANVTNVAITVAVAPIVPAVGGVTVETAFSQSVSSRIDAVVIDRAEGSHVFNSSMWSTEQDVKSAFKRWAIGIRKAVDRAHGK